MGSEAEPAKQLLPYLQRADELQKHEPLVAYYCRLYAMERGLKIPQKERTKTTNTLLISLMNQLEKDKKSIKLGPEDNLYVEGFASNVFVKADKQDRAGRADLNTAKTFYAASIFYEILNQFGEVQPDLEQKQKYAAWKAAEIRKALKEGRKPEPGPPGGDRDLSIPSVSPTSAYDIGQNESFTTSQLSSDASYHHLDNVNSRQDPDINQSGRFQATHPSADTSSYRSEDIARSESFQEGYQAGSISHQTSNTLNLQNAMPPTSPSSYPSQDYPSSDYAQFPLSSRPDFSGYAQPYHQSYSNEHHPMPQNYISHDNPGPSYSYPNFQSYPAFNDSTFPSVPTHQPSYYHSPDPSYSQQSSTATSYPSKLQHDLGNGNVKQATPSPPPAASYAYDSSYQPPVEKIAEAHKAARFAVGALAFDDVAVALDHLRRSLDLLTNPSAETH